MKSPRLTAQIALRIDQLYKASGGLAARGDNYFDRGQTSRGRRAYRAAGRLEHRAYGLLRDCLPPKEQWLLIDLFAAAERRTAKAA